MTSVYRPYYRDQFPQWFAGHGIRAPFSERAKEVMRVHRLILLPVARNAQNR